jgi:aryl-alcohol dehydrogenase-like predicted oxidoreductase
MQTTWMKPLKKLGQTHIQVTPLGLGGAWLGYSPATRTRDLDVGAATVIHALDLGINLIDTSAGYGISETIIGKGLSAWFQSGGRREDIVISSKTGTRGRPKDYSHAATLRSVEQSLKDLGTSYIDVMLVHDPEDLEPVFAEDGALQALEQLKTEGIIRAIGLGVRNHAFHKRCIENGRFDMSLTYGDFNLLNQSASEDILTPASSRGMGIFNAMVVEYGLLGGRDPDEIAAEHHFHLDPAKVQRARELWQYSQHNNLNLLSLTLRYSARDPRVTATLVGASRPDEIEQDVLAFQSDVPENTWQELRQRFGL